MEEKSPDTVYTIGHSTHDIETFISMLQSFQVQLLADIRNFPGSRRYPHFNSENLSKSLKEAGIKYEHLKALGGRRAPRPDSKNDAWRVVAFRGYADYMETDDFKLAAEHLESLAHKNVTAYMCSEAVWWSCHRALVSDYLKARRWKVMHIMKAGKADEHPWTKPARIVDGKLTYTSPKLF
jgi:uncharacterized protein (DUF488 family)